MERIEKLALAVREDLTKFKLLITEANDQGRQLLIDETANLSKAIQAVNSYFHSVDSTGKRADCEHAWPP